MLDLLLSVIKDPMVRSFSMRKENVFLAFKTYVAQAEDKELDGKVNIVEKFYSRIPELVTRLYGCFESDIHKAGTFADTRLFKESSSTFLYCNCGQEGYPVAVCVAGDLRSVVESMCCEERARCWPLCFSFHESSSAEQSALEAPEQLSMVLSQR